MRHASGTPTGHEWRCVGKEYPSVGYNQGPRALHTLLTLATEACIPNADTDAIGDDMALDKDTAGQLAAVHVALPNLDPKDVSNPKAPIQHLNRRDRAGFMPYSAEDETYHGDGAWPRRWRKGRTDRGNKEAETLDSEDLLTNIPRRSMNQVPLWHLQSSSEAPALSHSGGIQCLEPTATCLKLSPRLYRRGAWSQLH